MNATPQPDDREPTLSEHIAAVMASPAFAQAITAIVIEQLRPRIGGRRVYMRAKDDKTEADRQQLIEQIKAEFNGRNIKELRKRHNISRAQIYRFLRM